MLRFFSASVQPRKEDLHYDQKAAKFFVHLHPVVQHQQHQHQHQQVIPVPHEMQAIMVRFSFKSMFGGAGLQDTILGAKNDVKPMMELFVQIITQWWLQLVGCGHM